MRDADCVALLQWALPRLRMRWPGFRKVRRQVCKRIARRMDELGLAKVGEYRALLEANEAEWRTLDACCRVTISRFLRDREVFQILQEKILPGLAEEAERKGRTELRCWSAGCGSGEEAYTLSLLWRLAPVGSPAASPAERFPGITTEVTGTDTDPKVLDRARRAVYPRGALKDLPQPWIPIAFNTVEDGFSLRRIFRENVRLLQRDIREAFPEGTFDLVLCRNLVFTYFEEELQREILPPLLRRLKEGGVFVIGSHEELPRGDWPLKQVKRGVPLYRKQGADGEGSPGVGSDLPGQAAKGGMLSGPS
jgi:chemotaxis protein methyltransferase CheR